MLWMKAWMKCGSEGLKLHAYLDYVYPALFERLSLKKAA